METKTTMQLGMVGLGRMGANMVRRLMKGGHECVVFNRSSQKVEELVKARQSAPHRPATSSRNSGSRGRFVDGTRACVRAGHGGPSEAGKFVSRPAEAGNDRAPRSASLTWA